MRSVLRRSLPCWVCSLHPCQANTLVSLCKHFDHNLLCSVLKFAVGDFAKQLLYYHYFVLEFLVCQDVRIIISQILQKFRGSSLRSNILPISETLQITRRIDLRTCFSCSFSRQFEFPAPSFFPSCAEGLVFMTLAPYCKTIDTIIKLVVVLHVSYERSSRDISLADA